MEENMEEKNEKEKTIKKILTEAPKTTTNELVAITGMSRRGIEDMLKRMKQKGIIKRVGATKGGHWEVI